ncbi:MAG: hypothetical protein ACR2NZ_12265 [Rubripirellula sp.]
MSDDDVYQRWKEQRTDVTPTQGFTATVMSEVSRQAEPETVHMARKRRSAGRYVAVCTAIVAASVIGVLRVTFALLFGIL